MASLGGKQVVQGSENNTEIEELGRFAIQQHNIQQNERGLQSFSRVVKTEQQVVVGTMYHLTIEAKQDGDSSPKLDEAKVWVKPWEKLQEAPRFQADFFFSQLQSGMVLKGKKSPLLDALWIFHSWNYLKHQGFESPLC